MSQVTDALIENCDFVEGGNLKGQGIYDLVSNNNRQSSISYEEFINGKLTENLESKNKTSKNIDQWCNREYLQGFLRYTLLYLRSKSYNPYGD
ncbi:TPA: hypothetical protein MC787_000336 [Klebsiella pneumoniae]|nr:hypothetical protein [Klebsiella pneumoniae]